MIAAPVLAAVALLLLPGAAERTGRRVPPQEWAWLCAVALGAGALLVEAVLVLRAAPGVLQAAGLASVARACARLLGPLIAGGAGVTWSAAAAAIMLPSAAIVAVARARRVRRRLAGELWLGEQRDVAGHPVVVLPTSRCLAASFEHHKPVIVLSQGLIDLLTPQETAAVVRHEAAHLARRHQRLLTVAGLITPLLGQLPGIRRSIRALHLAVERCADEDASQGSPASRDAVRTSLLRLATLPPAVSAGAAFADACTLAARVDALATPPPPAPPAGHLLLYLPGTAALLVAAPALYQWANQAHTILAMAGRCTT